MQRRISNNKELMSPGLIEAFIERFDHHFLGLAAMPARRPSSAA